MRRRRTVYGGVSGALLVGLALTMPMAGLPAAGAQAQAAPASAGALREQCRDANRRAECDALLQRLISALPADAGVCLPENYDMARVRQVVLDWLAQERPADAVLAATTAQDALADAYPCEE